MTMFTITTTTTNILAYSSFIFLSEHLGRNAPAADRLISDWC